MLIEFKLANFRSIGDEQVLSFVPSPAQKEHKENIWERNNYAILNAIALYGANGSGKSNILRALSMFVMLVHNSSKAASTQMLPYDPFLLREGYEQRPTMMELTFLVDGIRYRYGFEYSSTTIEREWLMRKAIGREVSLFEREGDVIEVSSGLKGSPKLIDTATEATKDNALYLSVLDMMNVDEAKSIMSWMNHMLVLDGLNTEMYQVRTVDLWKQPMYQSKIQNYLSKVGLDLQGLRVQERSLDLPQGNVREQAVLVKHAAYDKDGNRTDRMVEWNANARESEGSRKVLHMSGPILWSLANGGVLIVDEIEAKLHPIMTLNTIELFMDEKTNPNRAQLLFATHDTNLLTYAHLRRDQIYFTEKNRWESTELFSLSDFVYYQDKDGKQVPGKERPDVDKAKRYIEGRYGAIPMLGEFNEYIQSIVWQSEEK